MSNSAKTKPAQAKHSSPSWRDSLPIHPAANLFPLMTPAELKALGEDIKKNGMDIPVVLWIEEDGDALLLDGRNRLDAIEANGCWDVCDENGELSPRIGVREINATDIVEPFAFVISANMHRRHLTPEQKREIIAKVLKAQPEKSNRTIAKQVKADDKTVGSVRRELEATAEIPQLTKTVGADGKARSAKREPEPEQIETMTADDTPPDSEIERLRGRVEQLQRDIKWLEAEIAEKDRRIRELRDENRRLDAAGGFFVAEREIEMGVDATDTEQDAPDDDGGIPHFLRRVPL